jgi:putative SbcD/Mre11-related phosphoesterase
LSRDFYKKRPGCFGIRSESATPRLFDMSSLRPIGTEPALLLRRGKEKVVALGDLHIGWEVTLAQQGIHVPSQTSKMLERLKKIIESEKPSRIVMLGDVKHSVTGAELEEWRDVPEFFEALLKLVPSVQVITGNHDGNLEPLTPSKVQLMGPTGVALWGRFGLLHGHAWPSPEILGCETLILGHLHPAVTLRDALGYRLTKPVWVTAPCNAKKLLRGTFKAAGFSAKANLDRVLLEKFHVSLRTVRCIFIPPFNDFLGGRPVNSKRIEETHAGERLGPILRSGAVDMNEAEIHLLDGTYLGRVRQLRAFG